MKRFASVDEAELVRRARREDEQAFAELVAAYTPAVYRIVRRIVLDTQEAESIVQETFWRFWRKLSEYREDAPLLPYLATIASNLARDYYRRERWLDERGLYESDASAQSEIAPEDEIQRDQSLARLVQAVSALPPGYRAVISLRYDGGMSYDEIAQALALPLNTVRTHLRRAKQSLRERLEADDEG